MRRKQTESNVRTITTGHAEADMLGQVYLWVSERSNRLNAQRSHRKTYKKISNSQRYKMLGNGWTVNVIAHIMKGME